MSEAPPLVVVAGATATGKTQFAIEMAEAITELGRTAEIISADSRQVFRGMDVGTAKVGPADRRRVPHHGLDLVEPDAPFSVADFADHVRGVLADLAARDGVAILVGGTGFYLRAIGRGFDTQALPSDAAVRARIERDLQADGLTALVERLETLAPTRASSVDLRNPRRVARALEVAELVGDGAPPAPRGYAGPSSWIGLQREPAAHRARIDRRARAQFDAGLVEEARGLRERFDPNLPAFSAIGYHEAWAVLDGEIDPEEAIHLVAQHTAAFVKRQATWFRSEPGVEWVPGDTSAGTVVESLVERRALG